MYNLPKIFESFPTCNILKEKGELLLKHSNEKISFEKNIFGHFNIKIGENEYILSNTSEIDFDTFSKLYLDLLVKLSKEELFLFLEFNNSSRKFLSEEFMQELISTNEFYFENKEMEIRYSLFFEYEGVKADLFSFENFEDFVSCYYTELTDETELFKDFLNESIITFAFCIDEDDEYEFYNYQLDPKLRLKLVSGSLLHYEIDAYLIEIFEEIVTINYALEQKIVSEFYSDFESNEIAFNIKCYEEFLNEDLKVLGFYGNDDDSIYNSEYYNREDALEIFSDDLCNHLELKVESQGCAGKSGGYLVLKFLELNIKSLEKVISLIEDALIDFPSYYQKLENLDEDEVAEFISELDEEELDEEQKEVYEKLKLEITV